MSPEFLIYAGVVVLVAVAAFVTGRMTSPEKSRAALMEKELELTQKELDGVRGEVNNHFEQSARLFGRLAEDYRALYDHYSTSAVKLGFLKNGDASLLELADPHPLLEARSEPASELDNEPASELENELDNELENELAAEAAREEGPASPDEPLRAREAQA